MFGVRSSIARVQAKESDRVVGEELSHSLLSAQQGEAERDRDRLRLVSFLQAVPSDFNIKSKIEEILINKQFAEKRARHMDLDDFLG